MSGISSPASQSSWSPGPRMTGIRLCTWLGSSLTSVGMSATGGYTTTSQDQRPCPPSPTRISHRPKPGTGVACRAERNAGLLATGSPQRWLCCRRSSGAWPPADQPTVQHGPLPPAISQTNHGNSRGRRDVLPRTGFLAGQQTKVEEKLLRRHRRRRSEIKSAAHEPHRNKPAFRPPISCTAGWSPRTTTALAGRHPALQDLRWHRRARFTTLEKREPTWLLLPGRQPTCPRRLVDMRTRLPCERH